MNKKFGVCIVGCGYMGTIHAERWANNPQAEIKAVVDIKTDRADKLAAVYKLDRYYTDYREAVTHPEVDIVSVCVPTVLHPEVTIAAARAGKHVLSEKPAALRTEYVDQMTAAAEENGVKLGFGFMRQHSPVVQDLTKRLAAGEFGRPVLYNASDVRELRPKKEMHDPDTNGGPVIDMAVHLINMWGTMFDSEPVSVAAQGLRIGKDRPEISHLKEAAIDTATVLIKFASGDIGTFVVTWGLPYKVNPPGREDQFYGPHGLGQVTYGNNKQELQIMRKKGAWETLSITHENMYQNQADHFIEWIQGQGSFPAQGKDGKAALKVALAALESIKTGETIHL